MTDLTLTPIRLRNGLWEGRITGAPETGRRPEIRVSHLDRDIEGVDLTEGDTPGTWELSVPIPAEAIAEGVQTFLIVDAETDTRLSDFTLIAGEPAADDLRAEVALLRAELDMLKRAFRRHCLETT
ncbi:hypothetical protein SAMN05444007_104208 [Cribrihabitans marinus]|uniref:Uncharacterized protein n=1 Tax=Cribrihabitans marinus TaxID=1227549 RepID=A0A1H6XXV8_9RHOB|nr:hypothetical protein [Cribrihabitans marinus]GGH28211.1 hypothetical protein GCM10010973_17000 [Cribrihabitans marinus]SEJ33861.1 hypothetical protein SAMN05444007_104208 [Cribrihabitans marinus]